MTVKLPYMVTPGVIPKVLQKIQEARRTDRFTQDYLETMLGFRGGNSRAVIPLLKRMQFLGPDGSPTELYDKYRNEDTRGVALAEGVRKAFADVFSRNEFAFNMPREKFAALVKEMTGLEKDSAVAKAVVSTFFILKDGADFEGKQGLLTTAQPASVEATPKTETRHEEMKQTIERVQEGRDDVKLQVGYTINLNLPETTNPEVFNAIFKSLKENLLRN